MIEKMEMNQVIGKKVGVSFVSFAYIMSYMFYVILISLLINLVLAQYLEPLYATFQTMSPFWNFEYFMAVVFITFVYILLNFTMSFLSYKTVFWKCFLNKEDIRKFLFVVGFIFPVALFTFSFITEGEWFPLIINSITQILAIFYLKKMIKLG